MKTIITSFLVFITISVFGQAPDFDAIKNNVNDSSSQYFYDKISYQFRLDPGLLDSVAVQHLYYGKVYRKDAVEMFDKDYMEARDNFDKKKYKKAIENAEKVILKDPANLKMLEVLIFSLLKEDSASRYLPLYKYQVAKIINCFMNSGDGKKESSPYYVASVSDGYVLMNVKGNNPYAYKRTSQQAPFGIMDVYKKGKDKVHITVLYAGD